MISVQSCEKTAAQVEEPKKIHDPLELVVNGISGNLLNLSVSKDEFLEKAENLSELREFLLQLCDDILGEEVKSKALFLFGNSFKPPSEIGAQVVVTLIKSSNFIQLLS